ncbi:PKD domain-containing protein, partial [Flavobacterium sp.]|uniref:PKD domain-containing protein n=1 Tax=Flavobacterium sp. TaxID=239 RepID=UPI002FDA567D
MKTKLFYLLTLILFSISNLFAQFTTQTPDLRLCGSPPNYYQNYFNCTSNNYTLNQVFLSLTNVNGVPLTNTTCTPGTTQPMFIMLNYTSNSNSNINNVRLFADLNINGVTQSLNVWMGTVTPGSGQRLLFGPFNWVCGQEITLSRILVVWTTNNPSIQNSYTCNSYSKSQCEFPSNVTVAAPLAVQYTYKACRVGNNTTVNFTSTTNGGTPPYTFAWDFNNDGITDSTQQNPTHVFTTQTNIVTLRVTDSLGLTNTFTQTINSPTELMLSAIPNSPGCSGATSGSIDLTISGGTPSYSILWSNGATTEDLTNLSPGTYTVTVTDANNCQKTLPVTISAGDNIAPVVVAPAAITIQGCGTSFTSNTPPYSSVVANLTIAQFNQLGGSVTDTSVISNVTYQDAVSGSCPTIITRTFKAVDGCGNIGTATQTITVQDTSAPVFDALPAASTINC